MFYLLVVGALGYLILKKLDESDLYITQVNKKTRHTWRALQGTENIIQKEKLKGAHIDRVEYTAQGIPITYHQFKNGTIIQTYGIGESDFI